MDDYTLFTPGPVNVPDDILKEMSKPMIYHRENKFMELFASTADSLQKVLFTKGRVYFFASSGTGAMQAACSNILSPKDQPIVAICGKFGQRWLEICESYRTHPIVSRVDYGKSIDLSALEKILKEQKKQTVLFTTLTETSTGALNDIEALGQLSKKYNSYLIVDGVAGLGADTCRQDDWYIDILIGASQKALMSPPGIAFVSVNDRSFKKIEKSGLPGYYFNLGIYEKFRLKNQTPWTPAINVFYSLKKGLDKIMEKGVENIFVHHAQLAEYVRMRVDKMGMTLLPEYPSNALTVFRTPDNVTSTEIIKKLKEKHHILFADGQAELKGTIIRIGHMGSYDRAMMATALDALENILNQRRA
jgi:aspartate aminotransferase-like enzyme